MLRTGPRYIVEKRRDCTLLWNVRDFSMPRRMVASFPNHPYDKGESAILAEICAAALNRELPGRVADHPDPDLAAAPPMAARKPAASEPAAPEAAAPPAPAVRRAAPARLTDGDSSDAPAPAEAPAATAPVQPAPAPQPMTPLQAYAATQVARRERKAMPDVSGLKGRAKVQAMRKSLFGDDDPNAQGASHDQG